MTDYLVADPDIDADAGGVDDGAPRVTDGVGDAAGVPLPVMLGGTVVGAREGSGDLDVFGA